MLPLADTLTTLTRTGVPRAGVWLAEIGPNHLVALLLMTAGVLLLAMALRRGTGFARPLARDDRSGEKAESSAPRHVSSSPPPASPAAIQTMMREADELASLLAAQVDRQAARLERLITEADERIRKLERLSAAAAEPARPSLPSLRPDTTDPLNRRIYELADQGLPPVDIARTLDQQTGKVELILALRQR